MAFGFPMSIVSSSAPAQLQRSVPAEQRRDMEGYVSSPSFKLAEGSSSGGSGTGEIEEGRQEITFEGGDVEEEEEKVFVALVREVKEGMLNLTWVLQNTSRKKMIVVVHVHQPSKLIPMMGAWFSESQLGQEEVKAFRNLEREKMKASLDKYLLFCSKHKFLAEKLVKEADDIAKGLVELISQNGITNLVMGAAADKHFSKKMKAPKSKTAISVQKQADPFCKIAFVCKGNLICKREMGMEELLTGQSHASSPISVSSQSNQLRSTSLPIHKNFSNMIASPSLHEHFRNRIRSGVIDHRRTEDISTSILQGRPSDVWVDIPSNSPTPNSSSLSLMEQMQSVNRFSTRVDEGSETGSVTGITLPLSVSSSSTLMDEGYEARLVNGSPKSYAGLSLIPADEGGEMRLENPSPHGSVSPPSTAMEEINEVRLANQSSTLESNPIAQNLNLTVELEDWEKDSEVYEILQNALAEAEKCRQESYEESCRRQKAEKEAIEVHRRAKALENFYFEELKQRKELEEAVAREKLEIEDLRVQKHEIFDRLREAEEQKRVLEQQNLESQSIVKDLKGKVAEAHELLSVLHQELDEMQRERESAIQKAKDQSRAATGCVGPSRAYFLEFAYSELQQATNNFDVSLKIGEGGYGKVYKGFLRHAKVAIKLLNPESTQGLPEFFQELDVLSRVRHPNLVTLIGACPEASALVYEYLPNGSLDERLSRRGNTPPLFWRDRARIAAEICLALIFLHSCKPEVVVHGDLKTANILLDANLTSKLSDFGICRLLKQSITTGSLSHNTQPKGTFAYMDPEFSATGRLTPKSDIYSFGVILLRLLTGSPALGAVGRVQKALEGGRLQEVIDMGAGSWPPVLAKHLAQLALKCCEMKGKSRPDLRKDVWRLLEPLMTASSSSLLVGAEAHNCTPTYFLCSISQVIMRDPHMASDGYTYEGEAIKRWLDGGNETSPVTGLKLRHRQLVPNHALRSAIHEWRLQRQQRK